MLTDENVHPEVVTFLRGRGMDVATASEATLLGAEDVAVLRRATADNRLVLTHDADFGRLAIAAGEPLRWHHLRATGAYPSGIHGRVAPTSLCRRA